MLELLFDEIMELNRRAVNVGEFEVAYHLLAAALHAAGDDETRIDAVMELAREQADIVDAQPDHPLGHERATSRGTTPLFHSLVTTAEAQSALCPALRAVGVRGCHQ